VRFKLVEKTSGPHWGRVWREEEMTQEEVDKLNSGMSVVQWEPCNPIDVYEVRVRNGRGRIVFDDCTLEEANHFARSLPKHVAAKVVKK
jgi:hypothetical protein